ncbi:MAG: rRNA pseudouridine synthase [Akkermansiaceae bacterium]|nr:rRNA pseudouridine synthase [Akkermansiaceae bacterium]
MAAEATRLNKFLASCGVGSRRQCDQLVQDGHVTVNGEPCTKPATRVTDGDCVRVDGSRVAAKATTAILFHKPRGYVCTRNDEFGRETIYDLLPPKLDHLRHVGRLDADSEGLLVLTNDGDFANQLTHPRHKTEKEYLVTLGSAFDNAILPKLTAGVHTPEGKARAKAVKRLSPRRISMVLETGLKRQIREMFKTLGHRVSKLTRVRIGSLSDHTLAPGRWRELDENELALLLANPDAAPETDPARPARRQSAAAKKAARKIPAKWAPRKKKAPAKKASRRRPS